MVETSTNPLGAQTQFLPKPGAVSFKRSLDGTAWKNPVDRADDEPDHRELKEVIHSLERDPRTKRSNLVLASLRQDGVAAHENPEEQTEGRALCEWISPTVEEGVEVRDDNRLEDHREDSQWDDGARSGEERTWRDVGVRSIESEGAHV